VENFDNKMTCQEQQMGRVETGAYIRSLRVLLAAL